MKPTVTWVLIADGAEAKVFANAGPGKGLHAVAGLHFEQERLRATDIMADRPGRSSSSVGSGRSAIEPGTDPVQARERSFVEDVAAELGKHYRDGEFTRLVVAAAPTALGDLRRALDPALKGVVTGELPKDLTNVPTTQLASHFDGLLAV